MSPRLFITLPATALLLAAGFWPPPAPPSPYDSERWIHEGLSAEMAGDLGGAERNLKEAARVDHLFHPGWTLANYYFRHGNAPEFWTWSREALAVGTRDLGGLFDLCWRVSNDPEEISLRILPPRKETWNEYLMYLTQSGKWAAAGLAAAHLSQRADARDVPLLTGYCDLTIARGDYRAARAVWNDLCRRKLIPYQAEAKLTNASLATQPTGRGFDWSLPAVRGAGHSLSAGELRLDLNGAQPEDCVLLRQPLALDAETDYRFVYEFRSQGIPDDSGLYLEVLTARGQSLSSASWSRGELGFRGGGGWLTLVYRRAPGARIAEGSITLRNMDIQTR